MKEFPFIINNQQYNLKISNKISDLKKDWSEAARKSIYYDTNYLKILEDSGPLSYSYCYAILIHQQTPVGVYYFQKKTVELLKDFRIHTHSNNVFKKLWVFLQKLFFRFVKHEMLIFGNVLLTGEYAFYLKDSISKEHHDELNNKVIASVSDYIKATTGKKIQSVLAKDFYLTDTFKIFPFNHSEFYGFKVQPDMILKLDKQWNDYSDYLASVKSKYRVKFKKVASKGAKLEYKDLSYSDLEDLKEEMYKLYSYTSDRANFSLFKLDKEYFVHLKKAFPEEFSATAVFLNNELLAFYTMFFNGKNADAHFLGYNVKLNAQYQIYFNVLLNLVEKAILHRSDYLNLSRTALEIKSSVGAEPYPMMIYLRHNSKLINKVLPYILDRVVPKNEWVRRVPFK